jgi:branched-chain amino acid transport system substrate-binding protein
MIRRLVCIAGAVVAATVASGCGESSGPGTDGPIKIGVSATLSGPASVAAPMLDGARAYFETVNDKGGINGRKVEVIHGDNRYDPAQSARVARDLANKGAAAIISLGTPVFVGMEPLAEQLKIPMIVGASGDLVTPPKSNYLFGLHPEYTREALGHAEFIMEDLGITEFALAYQNDDAGKPASEVMPQYAKEHGGRLTASIPVAPDTQDFSPIVYKLKQSGAKAVSVFAVAEVVTGIQKAANAIGYRPKWITLFSSFSKEYLELAGEHAEGTYVTAETYPLTSDSEPVRLYTRTMRELHPDAVESTFAQNGWTMAAIVTEGIRKATGGGKEFDAAAVADELSMRGVPAGLFPSITYTAETHAGATQMAWYQVRNGEFVRVRGFEELPQAPAE